MVAAVFDTNAQCHFYSAATATIRIILKIKENIKINLKLLGIFLSKAV